MVSDVRLKIRMRLRVALRDIAKDIRPDGKLLPVFAEAKHNPLVNAALKEHYRTWVSRELPGCLIEFTRKNVYVRLPDSFPASNVPIREPLPVALVVAFHPPLEAEF